MNKEMTVQKLQRILANPFYCVNIHPMMCEEHEPLIDEEIWIKSAIRGIEENGAELFLKNLLENLKGNFVENPNASGVVDGYK